MATGYTKLSQFMTDRKYVIFRKFQDLAARDLLYIQAELVQLSIEFDEAAQNDRESDDDRQHYDREWWYLSNSELRGLDSEQWKTAMKIRRKLREYYDGVFQYAEIAAMTRPKKSELDLLRTWIESPHLGGGCGFLGRDLAGAVRASVYDENYLGDLMLLVNKRGEDDILTRFLAGPVLKGFHCFWKYWKAPAPLDQESPAQPGNESGLHHYSDEHVLKVADIFGTVASSLTPMMSIIALSYITSMRLRLGFICAFTLVFSASLAIATNARRVEIFSAAAAFAAVQVVFVGSTNTVAI